MIPAQFTTEDGCEFVLTETPEGDVLMQMKVEPHAEKGLATATVYSAPEGSKVVLGRYASVKLTAKDRAALRAALEDAPKEAVAVKRGRRITIDEVVPVGSKVISQKGRVVYEVLGVREGRYPRIRLRHTGTGRSAGWEYQDLFCYVEDSETTK